MLYSCFLFLTINFPIGVWVIMQWRGSRVTLFSVSKHTFIGVQVTSIGAPLGGRAPAQRQASCHTKKM